MLGKGCGLPGTVIIAEKVPEDSSGPGPLVAPQAHPSLSPLTPFVSAAPKFIKMFVLDEADEMLSRGFKDQIYDIFQKLSGNTQVRGGGDSSAWGLVGVGHLRLTQSKSSGKEDLCPPPVRNLGGFCLDHGSLPCLQVVLLSATMPMDVLEVTKKFMRDPIRILVKKEELTLEGIRQFYINVEREVSASGSLAGAAAAMPADGARRPFSGSASEWKMAAKGAVPWQVSGGGGGCVVGVQEGWWLPVRGVAELLL